MSETLIDFQIGEDYDNQRDYNRIDALEEFYRVITKKTMQVEHLVPKDLEGEKVYNKNKRVAKAIDWVLKQGKDFVYTTEITGKYGDYDEEFSYNFITYAKDHLSDALGYYKEK